MFYAQCTKKMLWAHFRTSIFNEQPWPLNTITVKKKKFVLLFYCSNIVLYYIMTLNQTKTKLRGFGPRANYTDRATAACWRS
jgi:hypothetical protein